MEESNLDQKASRRYFARYHSATLSSILKLTLLSILPLLALPAVFPRIGNGSSVQKDPPLFFGTVWTGRVDAIYLELYKQATGHLMKGGTGGIFVIIM